MKRFSVRSTAPSPAMVVASLALFVALGGVGYAAATGSIDGREIRDNSVGSPDVRNGTLQGRDAGGNAFGGMAVNEQRLDTAKLDSSRLGTVPRSADVSENGVDSSDIAQNSVRDEDLGRKSAGADELDDTVRRFGRRVQVPAGRTAVAKISCKGEEQLLSGGGRWGEPSLVNVAIQSSFSAGKNWTAIGANSSAATQGFQAFALCLRR